MDPKSLMQQYLYQYKTNPIIKYTVIGGFVLLTYAFSGRSFWITLVALLGLLLGRLSYNDQVDDVTI